MPHDYPILPEFTTWPTFPFEGDFRVRTIEPTAAEEPPRQGEDPLTCIACSTPDSGYLWVSARWRVRSLDRPTGLPMVLILESRSHLDLGDLPNLLAAELGVMTVRLERAIRSLDGVARVHVNRWGDGSAHLHLWFLARPFGQLQLRGTFLSLWDDILPPFPEAKWRENLAYVGAWLAEFGGRTMVDAPHIDWQAPSSLEADDEDVDAAPAAITELANDDARAEPRATLQEVEAPPAEVADTGTNADAAGPVRTGEEWVPQPTSDRFEADDRQAGVQAAAIDVPIGALDSDSATPGVERPGGEPADAGTPDPAAASSSDAPAKSTPARKARPAKTRPDDTTAANGDNPTPGLTDHADSAQADAAPTRQPPEANSPQAAPSEAAPSEGAPSEGAPSEGAPSEGAPSEGAPSEGAPSEGAPSAAAESEATPLDAVPNGEAATQVAPAQATRSEGAPAEASPTGSPGTGSPGTGSPGTGSDSAESAPAEDAPARSGFATTDGTPVLLSSEPTVVVPLLPPDPGDPDDQWLDDDRTVRFPRRDQAAGAD